MFRLYQSGPTCGDCTALYAVKLYSDYTVSSFIKEVLETRPDEWGYFGIDNGKSIFGDPDCQYKYGALLSTLPDYILDKKVVSVSANGGWTRMDYTIKIEKEKKSMTPIVGNLRPCLVNGQKAL